MGSWGLEKNKRSTRRKLSSLCSISSGGPPFLLLHYLWVVCPSYLHLLPLILATDLSTAAPDKQKKTERERKVTKWRRGVPGWRATGCRHRTRKITLPLSTFRKGEERERERAARPPRTLLPSSSQSSDGGGDDPAFRPGFLDWSAYLF